MSGQSPLTENGAELDTFLAMAREFPFRTVVYTLGLPLFAGLQLVHALLFGGSTLIVGGFAVLVIVCSIVLTRYHVAIYRRKSVEQRVGREA